MASGNPNATNELNIDEIVREVFARLATATEPAANGKATEQKDTVGELRLATKVVSLSEIQDRLNGAKRVIVPKGAVVTPAARDWLKQRRVSLAYGISAAAAVGQRLLVGVAETAYEPAALVRSLMQEGVSVERMANTGLTSVCDELCDGVAKGGSLGLLVTEQAASAVCLANRRLGTRASLAVDKKQIAQAVTEVGINLLVLAPSRHGLFELKQMVKEFLSGGPRTCPASLQARLG